MKHIPFAAFPAAERCAVLSALARSGIAPRTVCVSKLELAGLAPTDPVALLAAVTAPGWCRTYATGSGWVQAMELDLETLRLRVPPQQSQS